MSPRRVCERLDARGYPSPGSSLVAQRDSNRTSDNFNLFSTYSSIHGKGRLRTGKGEQNESARHIVVKDHDVKQGKNYYQFGAVAQLVARATPVRKVIWSRRVSLIFFFFASFSTLPFTFHCHHFPNILFFFLEVVITFYIACANSSSHIGEVNNIVLVTLPIYA
ncbi:hypothetical protein VN97_g10770 [Penicillium thymicola]|uniref:Uncharacterized protein n=1 Tax=Penicillium thymicola TaxID=293382 RepID=A0AAI9T8Z7_PENTH|nr:hypothetical protein VN97_g10770 [Penicillium thymicola]